VRGSLPGVDAIASPGSPADAGADSTGPASAPAAVRVAEVTAALEESYDPAWAEAWDAVGLVCGDPDAPVRRVLFAVDPVAPVIQEAIDWAADLLVTHHPLLLRPVHSVAASTAKGRAVHRLIAAGVALYTAHTNADVADPGVSDALARAVGLTGALRPLAPAADDPRRGLGRIGELAVATPLGEFVTAAAAGLPATAAGLRVAGEPGTSVRTVAVCGGAGDSLLAAARGAGADVYLTADLRHHPALEFREDARTALVDAAHWATEWPWLAAAASRLTATLAAAGRPVVETRVSNTVTDAWAFASAPGRRPDV
jgi:dinuclear metal center YbgI/SA1388 family protein